MVNSLYFPALSTISVASGSQLWRVATKTSNTYNNFLIAEMVFRYIENVAEFDMSGSYMTLFHQGVDSSNTGFSVVLYKASANADIQLGIRYKNTSQGLWTDLPGSFVTLNDIGNQDLDGFYFMFQYNYSNPNQIINFYVTQYNGTTNKTSPDFSFTTSSISINTTNLNQWGFGSLPQALNTNITGYDDTNSYNGYIAQNTQVQYLRTWNTVVPVTSSTAGTYAMFNTVDSTYSLYNLNKLNTYVPPATTGLNFQLLIPDNSTQLTDLYNNSVVPAVQVTLTTQSTSFQTLEAFAVNSTTDLQFVDPSQIPCLLKGTKILTPNGYTN